MKITIISQCIYPQMSPRSFRTFELAKQLAKSHEVTLYALLGDYDYSQIEKETGIKIRSIGKSHCGNIDSSNNRNESLVWRGIGRLVGKYIMFPQVELVPMVKSAVQSAKDTSDLIISIAKPYAIHFGVALAKKQCKSFPLWISDCGDPFMGDPYDDVPSYFEKPEKFWGKMTDYITVPIEGAKDAYYKEVHHKIRVIPQGFNFENVKIGEYKENEVVTFIFAGVTIPEQRDPHKFLMYLAQSKANFKFVAFTRSNAYFENYKELLGDKLIIKDYVPREQLILEMSRADFLLNIANRGSVQSPSKLIDYTLAKRPILNVTTDFNEKDVVDEFLNRDYTHAMPAVDISHYNIVNVAQKFIDIYHEGKK